MTPALNVSRETKARLEIYTALLRKWAPRINLISRSSVDDLWTRHVLDSAQLVDLAPARVEKWVDLGSGGGFPGLVVAILAAEHDTEFHTTLLESDMRKCAFLRTVIRETGVAATVIGDRIEVAKPQEADVISARALSDLGTLLGFTKRHLRPDGCAVFPKGKSWREEVYKAQTKWQFAYQVARSKTESGSVILSVTGVARA